MRSSIRAVCCVVPAGALCAFVFAAACTWGIYDGSYDGGPAEGRSPWYADGGQFGGSSDAAADGPRPYDDSGSDAGPLFPPLPSPRSAFATIEFNYRAYVFGGKDATGAPTRTVFAFEHQPQPEWENHCQGGGCRWVKLSDMPVARYGHAAASLMGMGVSGIFVIGGYDASGNPIPGIDRYDAMTDSWTSFGSLPTPRGEIAVAVDNPTYPTLIVAGGATQPGGSALTTVDSYNALSNTWNGANNVGQSIPPLSTARRGASGASAGGYAAVIGGAPSQSSIEHLFGSSRMWSSSGPPLSRGRGYAAAVTSSLVSSGNGGFVNNGAEVVLVLGGSDGATVLSEMEAYVPGAGIIGLPPMPTPRKWLGAAHVERIVIAIGGEDANGRVLDLMEVFNTQTGRWY